MEFFFSLLLFCIVLLFLFVCLIFFATQLLLSEDVWLCNQGTGHSGGPVNSETVGEWPVLLNRVSLPEFKLNISLWQWAHRKGSAGRNGLWFPSVTPGLLASTTSISSVHRLHFTPLCHLCKLLPLPLPSLLWSKYIYFWIKYQLVSIWWLPLELRDDNNLH